MNSVSTFGFYIYYRNYAMNLLCSTEHVSDRKNSHPTQTRRERETEEKIGTNMQWSWGEETEGRNGHKH